MLLLLLLQKMVTLVVLAVLAVLLTLVIPVALTLVIPVVVVVVEPIFVCVISLEAFVALLHRLPDHMESEDRMVVVGGWYGAKFFLLLERGARMLVAVRSHPRSWPVVVL